MRITDKMESTGGQAGASPTSCNPLGLHVLSTSTRHQAQRLANRHWLLISEVRCAASLQFAGGCHE
jgi:hypothetical protein